MPSNEARRLSTPPGPAPKFPVPWGLFVILALYGLGVLGFIWKTYWHSPEYKAAELSDRALLILGVDDGRKATPEQLREAFDDFLEAGRMLPEESQFAENLERLRNRFEERRIKLDPERIRRAEAVSELARRVQEQRAPLLVIGARDRHWAPDQLIAGPTTIALWSIPGAVLIIGIWAYLQVSSYLVRSREHAAQLEAVENEVKQLGRAKSRPRRSK